MSVRALTGSGWGQPSRRLRGGGCALSIRNVGVPRKTVSVGEMPKAYGRRSRCGVCRTVLVAVLGVGDDGGQGEAGRSRTANERQGEAPLFLKGDRAGNPRRRPARQIAHPRLWQMEQRAHRGHARCDVQNAAVTATWQFATFDHSWIPSGILCHKKTLDMFFEGIARDAIDCHYDTAPVARDVLCRAQEDATTIR